MSNQVMVSIEKVSPTESLIFLQVSEQRMYRYEIRNQFELVRKEEMPTDMIISNQTDVGY